MSNIARQAARAATRIIEEAARDMHSVEEADAAFDGGEWSRAAHANMQMAFYDGVIERVANRFNVAVDDVYAEVMQI